MGGGGERDRVHETDSVFFLQKYGIKRYAYVFKDLHLPIEGIVDCPMHTHLHVFAEAWKLLCSVGAAERVITNEVLERASKRISFFPFTSTQENQHIDLSELPRKCSTLLSLMVALVVALRFEVSDRGS